MECVGRWSVLAGLRYILIWCSCSLWYGEANKGGWDGKGGGEGMEGRGRQEGGVREEGGRIFRICSNLVRAQWTIVLLPLHTRNDQTYWFS